MQLPGLFDGQRGTRFSLLVLNGFAQGGLTICNAWFVMQLFERLTSHSPFPLILFAGLCMSITTGAMLRRKERMQAEFLGQDYARSIRAKIFSRLLRSNPRKLDKLRNGSLLLRFVGDLSAIRQWVSLGLSRLLVAGISLLVVMVALAWLHWQFAIGVMFVIFIAALWTFSYSKQIHEAVANARRRQAYLAANVSDKIGNLSTIQAYGQQKRESRYIKRQATRLIEAAQLKAARIGSLRAVMEGSAGTAVAVVLGLAFLPGSSDLSASNVVAVIMVLGFMAPSLRDIGRAHEYWLASRVAREKLETLGDRMPRLRFPRNARPLKVAKGTIQFNKVVIEGVFDALTIRVSGGKHIALCGKNGSGKSTLLGLAGRLFDTDHGHVLIDGQDLRKVTSDSLRRQVAYVSPDLPLLRGSLRKNLTYGSGIKLTEDQLREHIIQQGYGDLLKGLPESLDRRIRNGGTNLSAGQRMRITLLRALLSKPRILLLDEADSYLDAQALDALYTVIQDFIGTLLIATHKPSTIAICDESWQFDNGSVAQSGLQATPPFTQEKRSVPICNVFPISSQ